MIRHKPVVQQIGDAKIAFVTNQPAALWLASVDNEDGVVVLLEP